MANQLSLPSWHEDQPSALETGLSTQIGARNPMGAVAMLIPEIQARQQARSQYQDYLSGINDTQRQNIGLQHQENTYKALGDFVQHYKPGAGDFMHAAAPDLIRDPASYAALERNSASNDAAKRVHDAGSGYGAFMQGGGQLDPGAVGQFLPGTTGITEPAMMGAARIRTAGEAAVAGMKMNNDKNKVHIPLDKNDPLNTGYKELTGPAATAWMAQHPESAAPSEPPPTVGQTTAAIAKLNQVDKRAADDVRAGGSRSGVDEQGPYLQGKTGRRYRSVTKPSGQ